MPKISNYMIHSCGAIAADCQGDAKLRICFARHSPVGRSNNHGASVFLRRHSLSGPDIFMCKGPFFVDGM